MQWEYGWIVAVQTTLQPKPLRVAQINGLLFNEGRIWESSEGNRSPFEILNEMGRDRWELVSVVITHDGYDDGSVDAPPQHRGRTFVYHLKRSMLGGEP